MKLFLVAALVALTQAQVFGNSNADEVSTAGWDLKNYVYKTQTYKGLYCEGTADCRQTDWYTSGNIDTVLPSGFRWVHNATTEGEYSGQVEVEGFDSDFNPTTLELYKDGSFCDKTSFATTDAANPGVCKICPYTDCGNMPDDFLDGHILNCVRGCTLSIGYNADAELVRPTVSCKVSNQDAVCGTNYNSRDLLYGYIGALSGIPGAAAVTSGRGGFFCGQNTQPTESLPDPLGRCLSCATINSNPHLGRYSSFTSATEFTVAITAEGSLKQCVNYPYFGLNNVANRITCRLRCELIEVYTQTRTDLDAELESAQPWRFSYMESLCSGEVGSAGCCNTFGVDACEVQGSTTNPTVLNFDYEFGQCGYRECVADQSGNNYCFVFAYQERSQFLGASWESLGTDGDVCAREVRTGSGEIKTAGGVCSDGTCIVVEEYSEEAGTGHECPNGYEAVGAFPFGTCQSVRKDYVVIAMGGSGNAEVSHPETNSQDQCQLDSGACDTIGPGKDLLCFSYAVNTPKTDGNADEIEQSQYVNASLYMNYFDPGQTFNPSTDIRATVVSLENDDAGDDVIHASITGDLTQMGQLAGSFGECWIAEPNSPKANDCLINEAGIYLYKHHEITWSVAYHGPEENPTERITILFMPDLLRPMVGVLSCANQPFDVCRGQMTCDYTTTSEGDHPCHGNYTECRNVTASPTMYPTREPTSPPVTAHGDPIIWTFGDDCYDLNKDGMYTASKHASHDHEVQIGVYNDFMRNIQVVRDGEVILDINNFGEVVGAETYPYSFTSEVKKCPADMKKTECNGEYTQHEFDAQNFRYIVQSGLRHDYADEALSEGELGYHLDIYPRPYTNFDEVRAGYSGLFFENPLPEELPYCPGGSARRQ